MTLKAAMQEEYRQTGQCKLTIAAKNEDGNLGHGWGMAKASPYREKFNRGYIVLINNFFYRYHNTLSTGPYGFTKWD